MKPLIQKSVIALVLGTALLSLGGCLYLASINQPWVAGALVGLPLAGVIRALRNQPTSAPPKP